MIINFFKGLFDIVLGDRLITWGERFLLQIAVNLIHITKKKKKKKKDALHSIHHACRVGRAPQ